MCLQLVRKETHVAPSAIVIRSASVVFFLCCLLAPKVVTAQPTDSASTEATPNPDIPPELRINLGSPRQALEFFFNKIEQHENAEAAVCLNITEMSADTAATKSAALAFKLKYVIDRIAFVDLDQVEADSESQTFQLSSATYVETSPEAEKDAQQIIMAPDADALWKFTPATVALIDDMFSRWDGEPLLNTDVTESVGSQPFSVWLASLFPESLQQKHFLLSDYLWICLLAVVALGVLADLLVRRVIVHFTNVWSGLKPSVEEVRKQRASWLPLGLLIQALVWYLGTAGLGLPDFASDVLLVGLRLVIAFAAAWSAFRLIDGVSGHFARRANETESKFDDLLVPLISSFLKLIAVTIGFIICAKAFGIEVPGLLGGLGLGGAAIALASKDAISNFFGSFTVLVDRPFEIGDWIASEDIEGVVESVGFRSTRVRTFHNSVITLPNSRLTTAVVDNMGKRRYRRFKMNIGVQYDTTTEQIDAFCEGIRELIRRHPYTRKDSYHVYLNNFGPYSLDILLYCFVRCPDWSMELRERHRLLTDILQLAKQLHVSLAFPTQSLHLHQEENSERIAKIEDPSAVGRSWGANIAGPLLPPDERPGRVEFSGPSKTD